MKRLERPSAVRAWRQSFAARASLGFVPTMGALHAGHEALITRARQECDRVLVSIFVNATQFNDPADCSAYPQPLEEDLRICEQLGVDAVFTPAHGDLYPDNYRYRVEESEASLWREGAHRPGHFAGVLTVVMKLFQIVAPERAYFGEKDWQQLQLVRGMAEAFFLPIQIIACPTRREPDGLAMSSRNVRLSGEGRNRAALFPKILRESTSAGKAAESLEQAGLTVDYVEDVEGRRLGAVTIDGVRLIDNLSLAENPSANGGER